MNTVPALATALGLALVTTTGALAQDNAAGRHRCLEELIQAKLQAQQPVRLSATTVTLTGDTLRLAGRATVRFDDTTIRFEEIVLNQSSKRITFVGNGTVFNAVPPCAGELPKIEFR